MSCFYFLSALLETLYQVSFSCCRKPSLGAAGTISVLRLMQGVHLKAKSAVAVNLPQLKHGILNSSLSLRPLISL